MKRFAKLLVVTLGFGALGFVMSLVPQKNATGAGAAPVFVTNASVPVNGTVALAPNTTVGITGNVNVVNPLDGSGTPIPLRTRDVSAASRQPFAMHASCDLSVGCDATVLLTAAPHTIYVVESASGGCTLTGSSSLQLNEISLAMRDPTNTTSGAFVEMVPVLTGGSSAGAPFTSVVFSAPTEFDVANASDSSFVVILQLSTNASSGGCTVSLVGYAIGTSQ